MLLYVTQENLVPDRFGKTLSFLLDQYLHKFKHRGAKSGLDLQVTGAQSDVRTPSILEPLNRKFLKSYKVEFNSHLKLKVEKFQIYEI